MIKRNSIIYVNFSPYENTGNILDYLLENFRHVFLFSLNFHKLGKEVNVSRIKIFIKGRLIHNFSLYQVPTPARLVFLLLPLRSILLLLQIIWYSFKFKRQYGEIDYYFTVNAYTAWIGIILKKLHQVKKTIFWIWDYYPPIHEDKIVSLMRWIYWQFDKVSSYSDKVIYLNERLKDLRKHLGVIHSNQSSSIIPIGTNPINPNIKSCQKAISLGFIGVLKKSQGLNFIFDNAEAILKEFPNICLDIIGTGPDENYFRQKAKKSTIKTNFHGLLSEQILAEEKKIRKILQNCHIGIAPYVPDESNASYYGDPSKVKKYLALGLPVVTTNVYLFSRKIAKAGAGELINYSDSTSLINALKKIFNNYGKYQSNALVLAKKYYYKKIYKKFF